ncbi:MAG: ribosome maturation factor RimP [Halanaerobiales bacterium]|nr:ribosome maturation factor RimP [Halanaerobiales bacterium]
MSRTVDQLIEIIKPIVNVNKLELVDLEYIKEGEDWILRVFVENKKGKLTIDQLSDLSRLISQKLDEKEPIDKKYFLEVSSPGVERPLKKVKDYKRFKGRDIKISTYKKHDNKKEFIGKLIGIDKDDLVKIILKDSDEEFAIKLAEISKAHLYEDFDF